MADSFSLNEAERHRVVAEMLQAHGQSPEVKQLAAALVDLMKWRDAMRQDIEDLTQRIGPAVLSPSP